MSPRSLVLNIFYFLFKLTISLFFAKKNVYFVTGLRRSGNHLFINWLASSLESKEVIFEQSHFSISPSKKTILFNEINYAGTNIFTAFIWKNRKLIKESETIIISTEDYLPNKFSPFIPIKSKKIIIKRSLLNTIASRIQRAKNQAEIGLDRGDMTINKKLIAIYTWISNQKSSEWITWSFDEWVANNGNYRENFLILLNLKYCATPKISTHGGGSSFSGDSSTPSKNELSSRWLLFKFPERVITLLNENIDILDLTDDERIFLKETMKNKITVKN